VVTLPLGARRPEGRAYNDIHILDRLRWPIFRLLSCYDFFYQMSELTGLYGLLNLFSELPAAIGIVSVIPMEFRKLLGILFTVRVERNGLVKG
jgi:hypothetical protein